MKTISKRVRVKRSGKLITLFDTQAIVQNTSEYSFFPANAVKSDPDNNYVSNPLPGPVIHKVLGISLESTLQTIKTATNIDPVKIINALKHASLIIKVDNDRKQMLHIGIEELFNFAGSEVLAAGAHTGAAASFQEYANLKSRGIVKLAEPFQIGKNQSFEVKLEFKSAANFPTAAHWTTAAYGSLNLKAKLLVSQETPDDAVSVSPGARSRGRRRFSR